MNQMKLNLNIKLIKCLLQIRMGGEKNGNKLDAVQDIITMKLKTLKSC